MLNDTTSNPSDTTATPVKHADPFAERFTKWRHAMKDQATGPLTIALEVLDGEPQWDEKASGGLSYAGALVRCLGKGKGVDWFRRRAAAVTQLGGMRVARMFDHHAAVWVTSQAHDAKLAECVTTCARAYNANRKVPLTVMQVSRAVVDVLGRRRTRVHVGCVECAAKDAEIERLREMVGEDERSEVSEANQRERATVSE